VRYHPARICEAQRPRGRYARPHPRQVAGHRPDRPRLGRCEVVTLATRLSRSVSDVHVQYDGPRRARSSAPTRPSPASPLEPPAQRRAGDSPWHACHGPCVPGREETGCLRGDRRRTGHSREARQHLFDAFFTTRSHGSGIGLAVSSRSSTPTAGISVWKATRAGVRPLRHNFVDRLTWTSRTPRRPGGGVRPSTNFSDLRACLLDAPVHAR